MLSPVISELLYLRTFPVRVFFFHSATCHGSTVCFKRVSGKKNPVCTRNNEADKILYMIFIQENSKNSDGIYKMESASSKMSFREPKWLAATGSV